MLEAFLPPCWRPFLLSNMEVRPPEWRFDPLGKMGFLFLVWRLRRSRTQVTHGRTRSHRPVGHNQTHSRSDVPALSPS